MITLRELKAVLKIWKLAWAEALVDRRAVLIQVLALGGNGVVWLVFWFFFFRRVGVIRSWGFNELVTLLVIAWSIHGVVIGGLSNVRRLGELISTGRIDATLALPGPTLPFLLVRKIDALQAGNFVVGLGVYIFIGQPSLVKTVLVSGAIIAGSVVLTSLLIVAGSLSFYTRHDAASDLGFHAVSLFMAYPADIFGRGTRFMMYAVVPAAFVTTVPARMIFEFSRTLALVVLVSAVVAPAIATKVFYRGLERYTSGAVWTTA